MYDTESAEALALSLSDALPSRSGGEAIVAFDRALNREVAYDRFLHRCAAEGLTLVDVPQVPGEFTKDSVSIYSVKRSRKT